MSFLNAFKEKNIYLHYFLLYGFSGVWHLDRMYTVENWFF